MDTLTTALVLNPTSSADTQPGAVLRCAGEIDLTTIGPLKQALAAAMAMAGAELEVDLREVYYLDSAALAALLRAYRALTCQRRTLKIRAHPRLVELFRLVGLDQVLDVRAG